MALSLAGVAIPTQAVPVLTGSIQVNAPAPSARQIRLITGDLAVVSVDHGTERIQIKPAARSGVGGQFTVVHAGGDIYAIPKAAQLYLDRILDRSLFDVSAFTRVSQTGRVPVTVQIPAGSKPTVAGLTITSRSGSSASGYLALSSAAAFGAALDRQWSVDAQSGHHPAATLFGISHLALRGAVSPVRPDFPQVTLIIKALDRQGRPADGLVGFMNVDNPAKYINFVEAFDGEARISVPLGHYAAIMDNTQYSGGRVNTSVVTRTDLTVSANDQRLVLDARQATATPTVATPRPAHMTALTLEWERSAVTGSLSFADSFNAGSVVHVQPAAAAIRGLMNWITTWTLVGAPTSGSAYSYDLTFDDNAGIPSNLSRSVASFQLATINARYYGDGYTRVAQFGRVPLYPFEFFAAAYDSPVATPSVRTEYVYSAPSVIWFDTMVAYSTVFDPFAGFIFDGGRSYLPGTVRTTDWLRGPLAPGIAAQQNGDSYYPCQDCRSDTQLGLFLSPYLDSTPGHFGELDDGPGGPSPVARFRVFRNGTLLKDEKNTVGDVVRVPTGVANYRVIQDIDRTYDGVLHSTTAHTEWVFSSGAGQGATLPDGWICPLSGGCRVLSLLQVSAPMPGDLYGTVPNGATVDITVTHVQGAVASAITSASVALSSNGGATFTNAPITALGNGRYRVTLHGPHNALETMQIKATDAAGGSISQTVTDAYTVSNSG